MFIMHVFMYTKGIMYWFPVATRKMYMSNFFLQQRCNFKDKVIGHNQFKVRGTGVILRHAKFFDQLYNFLSFEMMTGTCTWLLTVWFSKLESLFAVI